MKKTCRMKRRFFDSASVSLFLSLILPGILLFVFCFSACSVSSENSSSESDFKSVRGKVVTQSIRRSAVFTGLEVRIENFSMCSHEVTQKEYEEFCTYNGAQPKEQFGKGDDFPVYFVSFYDALVYCNRRSSAEGLSPCYKIKNSSNTDDWGSVPGTNVDNAEWDSVECDFSADGYRLPTEEEWEYAARGGEKLLLEKFSGSYDVFEVAWFNENTKSASEPVKQKTPNALGLYDMSENIQELCWLKDGKAVIRGGSFDSQEDSCAVYARGSVPTSARIKDTGFRVVRK